MTRETISVTHGSVRGGAVTPVLLGPREGFAHLPGERSRRERPGADERDRRLMERIRSGDEEAFRCLFETYWNGLMAYAANVMGAGEECQDVVLQAFVRVWSHREEWEPSGVVRPYLYRITRNLALNARRDRVLRAERQEHAALIEPHSQHHRTPAERLRASRLRDEVETAIARLPERRREAFVLARFHGLTHREIAETLGIAHQTVANQLSAAMADLRASLAHHMGNG